MHFKLSDATIKMLANKSAIQKSKLDVNSQKFYKQHPDLAPKNVYLASGRIMKKETVDSYLDSICKKSFFESIFEFIKRNIIRRN